MQVETLFAADVAATKTSKTVGALDNSGGEESLVWQLTISATGTVAIEGSLDGTTWNTLVTNKTVSEIFTTMRPQYVRARITANTGTTTVSVAH